MTIWVPELLQSTRVSTNPTVSMCYVMCVFITREVSAVHFLITYCNWHSKGPVIAELTPLPRFTNLLFSNIINSPNIKPWKYRTIRASYFEDNKDIWMTVKTQQIYYDLLLQGYMFRLLRIIIRPSNEPTQDYLIPNAFRDPVALTIGVVIVLSVHVNFINYSVLL